MNKNAQFFPYFTPFIRKNQYFFVKFFKKRREIKCQLMIAQLQSKN